MAQYKRKALTVEARVYEGPKLTVVSDEKGVQIANSGDYLIGNERGKVTVATKTDFEKDFEEIVTGEGKTQAELDAELETIRQEEAEAKEQQ